MIDLDLFAGPGGWSAAARELGLPEVGIEWDRAACATRAAAGHRTVHRTGFRFYGIIISGTARCVNTKRPLTHSLDLGEEGLVMHASRPSAPPLGNDVPAEDRPFRRRIGDQVATSREEWDAIRAAQKRERYAQLTPEEHAAKNARRVAERAAWTPERAEAARAADRERYARLNPEARARKAARQPLTEEQREVKNRRGRARSAQMTRDRREQRLQQARERMRRKRATQTPEEREAELREHRDRERARRANWTDEERTRFTLRDSAKRIGLDPDFIEAHFFAHDGRCDICGRTVAEVGGRYKRLAVDHDHATGEFRGILCDACNHAIGMMQDSPERLMAAAEYLIKAHVSQGLAS